MTRLPFFTASTRAPTAATSPVTKPPGRALLFTEVVTSSGATLRRVPYLDGSSTPPAVLSSTASGMKSTRLPTGAQLASTRSSVLVTAAARAACRRHRGAGRPHARPATLLAAFAGVRVENAILLLDRHVAESCGELRVMTVAVSLGGGCVAPCARRGVGELVPQF